MARTKTKPRKVGQCDHTDERSGRLCLLVTAHATPHIFTREGEQYENTKRIDRTEKALRVATDLGDDEAHPAEDRATALADMLGNLLHWATLHRVDFEAALERGREYFDEETTLETEELKDCIARNEDPNHPMNRDLRKDAK